MANPGPVAQTFFVDEDVQGDFRLDGIITLVDAKHLELHLGHQQEAHEQVAFADVIVVNKIDLVDEAKLVEIERRLRGINAMARVMRGSHGDVPLAEVLDVGGFDLDRALSIRPTFLEPEYPFEWVGIYQLAAGTHEVQLQPGPDPTMRILIDKIADGDDLTIAQAAERVHRRMTEAAEVVKPRGNLAASGAAFELALDGEPPWSFGLPIVEAGRYAIFTQHLPAEFELTARISPVPGRTTTMWAGSERLATAASAAFWIAVSRVVWIGVPDSGSIRSRSRLVPSAATASTARPGLPASCSW